MSAHFLEYPYHENAVLDVGSIIHFRILSHNGFKCGHA